MRHSTKIGAKNLEWLLKYCCSISSGVINLWPSNFMTIYPFTNIATLRSLNKQTAWLWISGCRVSFLLSTSKCLQSDSLCTDILWFFVPVTCLEEDCGALTGPIKTHFGHNTSFPAKLVRRYIEPICSLVRFFPGHGYPPCIHWYVGIRTKVLHLSRGVALVTFDEVFLDKLES